MKGFEASRSWIDANDHRIFMKGVNILSGCWMLHSITLRGGANVRGSKSRASQGISSCRFPRKRSHSTAENYWPPVSCCEPMGTQQTAWLLQFILRHGRKATKAQDSEGCGRKIPSVWSDTRRGLVTLRQDNCRLRLRAEDNGLVDLACARVTRDNPRRQIGQSRKDAHPTLRCRLGTAIT
jgi:hypothetical protein